MDAFLDDLENFLNTTKIDNSNIQDGGIDGSLKLTTASVVESKLASAAVTTSKIADASITTAKIIDANITTAKIADSNVTTAKIADSNVTTAKIADSNVTTAKLADGAVTAAKKAALGQQTSGSSGYWTTASGSYSAVTNLSVSITTTGRPVFIGLISDGDLVNVHYIASSSNTNSAYLSLTRAGTEVSMAWVGNAKQPLGSFWHIDTPAAGTYTYAVRGLASSNTLEVSYAALIAYEL